MGRRGGVLCLACAASVLASAAIAWACVPASYLWMEPAFGTPGKAVTVHGEQFEGGSVEVRWGSETGPLLATAPSANFTATIEIPSAADGVYTVLALTRNADGSIREWARTPFEVTSSSSAGSWGDGGYGQRPAEAGGWPSPAPRPSPGPTASTPLPSPRGGFTPGSASPVPQDAGRALLPQPVSSPRDRAGEPRTSLTVPAQGRRGSKRAAFFAGSLPVAAPTVFFAGSLPSAVRADLGGFAVAPARTGSAVTRGASEGSATGEDLWSGFTDGNAPSLSGGGNDAIDLTDANDASLTVGVGLLGLGLVGVFGGLAVAELRRRRAYDNRVS